MYDIYIILISALISFLITLGFWKVNQKKGHVQNLYNHIMQLIELQCSVVELYPVSNQFDEFYPKLFSIGRKIDYISSTIDLMTNDKDYQITKLKEYFESKYKNRNVITKNSSTLQSFVNESYKEISNSIDRLITFLQGEIIYIDKVKKYNKGM